MPRTPKNPLFTKFVDLKGAVFCVGFGEAKLIRLTPMSANEPKNAEKPPFKADLGLNALAKAITNILQKKYYIVKHRISS